MNGQYLCNRQITVSYAYKKDTKGERHGTPAGEPLSCHFFFFMVSIKAFRCFCTIFSYLLIFPLMQKEFWLQVIRRHRRAGLILYLQVGHHHFPMLLRLMVPFLLQCLLAPSLMVSPPLLFMSSKHHLHKPQPFSLCRCHHLDNKHGINNSKVNQ